MSTIGNGLVTSAGASHSTYIGPRITVPHGPSKRSAPVQKNPRREVTGGLALSSCGEGIGGLLVVVVCDLLEPLGLAHRDREVQQEGVGRAAVPVALAGRDVGDVAGLEHR